MSFVSNEDIISILQGVSQKAGQGVRSWTANTQYAVGNLVIYNNSLYKCTTANSDATFDENNWQIIGGGSSGSSVNAIVDILWENTTSQVLDVGDTLSLSHPYSDYDYILMEKYQNGFDPILFSVDNMRRNFIFSTKGGNIYSLVFNISNPNQLVITECINPVDSASGNLGSIFRITGFKFLNSNVYSTTEQRIGTWIDGKPLYQKTIVTTTPSVADTDTTVYTEAGSFDMVKLMGDSYVKLSDPTSDTYNPVNMIYDISSANYNAVYLYVQNNTLHIAAKVGTEFLNSELVATIQYTKTSSTPPQPAANIIAQLRTDGSDIASVGSHTPIKHGSILIDTYNIPFNDSLGSIKISGSANYIYFDQTIELDSQDTWTVSLWVCATVIHGVTNITLPSDNSYANTISLRIQANNHILFRVNNTVYASSIVPTANTWYNLAITNDGTNTYMFVDGNLIQTISSMSFSIKYLCPGYSTSGTNAVMFIDDFCVLNECKWTTDFTLPTTYLS